MKFKKGDNVRVAKTLKWTPYDPTRYLEWFVKVKGIKATIVDVDDHHYAFKYKLNWASGILNFEMYESYCWCFETELEPYNDFPEVV